MESDMCLVIFHLLCVLQWFVELKIRGACALDNASSQTEGALIEHNRLARGDCPLRAQKSHPSFSIFNFLDDAWLVFLAVSNL